jgi:hypothetical protein
MLLAWYCSIFHIEMTDRKTVRRDGAAAEWPNRYEGQFISEAVLRPSGSAQLGFHRSLTGFNPHSPDEDRFRLPCNRDTFAIAMT